MYSIGGKCDLGLKECWIPGVFKKPVPFVTWTVNGMPLQPALMSLTCIVRNESSSEEQCTNRGRKVQRVEREGWLRELAEQRRQWSEWSLMIWRMDVMRSV